MFGAIPVQAVLFILAAAAIWLLLERSTLGRGLYAIGFSPEGARHAGIPVQRRLTVVYVLSGVFAALAAITAAWEAIAALEVIGPLGAIAVALGAIAMA